MRELIEKIVRLHVLKIENLHGRRRTLPLSPPRTMDVGYSDDRTDEGRRKSTDAMQKTKRPAVQNEDGSFTSAVTLQEVAAMFGLEYDTAKQRVLRGKLPQPVLVLGTVKLWPRKQIEALAKQERARAGKESAGAGA